MTEIFCNNCGHRNALGSNFCSSCGSVLETQAPDNTTITFHPIEPVDPLDDEPALDIGELGDDVGVMVVKRGPAAGSRFVLDSEVTTAGRHPDSHIFLDDITVSRRHAEIRRVGGGYQVTDAGSLNGTYVNRERIERTELHNGDEVQIGKFKLVFLVGSESSG